MNEIGLQETHSEAGRRPPVRNRWSRYVPLLAVLFLSLWVTAGAISKSYLIGRLADPITHNDVNYIIDGIQRLLYIEVNGFWAEVAHFYSAPMHAPLSGYQASLAFFLFGFQDWAPYASNIIYVLVFLWVCALLLRGAPVAVIVAGLLAVVGMPLTFNMVSEFAPEIPLGLFSAVGVILLMRIPLPELALRSRIMAGLCFGLALIGKPSSFVFVPLVVCVTLGVAFLRDVVFARRPGDAGRAIWHGSLQLVLALWLPALYLIPNFQEFSSYFYRAMFDAQNVKAYGGVAYSWSTWKEKLLLYLTGRSAEYTFGDFLWAYIAVLAAGLAAASWRGERRFIARQVELFTVMAFMWLLPALSTAKNTLLAAPAAYLLAFMVVASIGAIYQAIRGAAGVACAVVLGVLLMVSGTSLARIPNTPGFDWHERKPEISGAHIISAQIVREALPLAMDRFRDVILGNAPEYRRNTVYMTNVGYYHAPVLWYWFLKKDPMLDWTFLAPWIYADPAHHLDNIRRLTDGQFVIAGERSNGLTFAPALIPGAAAAEDAVLAALWKAPDFMPLDRFYGPTGRTITVFQKRTSFAGWRPLAGMVEHGISKRFWTSDGTISHLQAYAPTAIAATLSIAAHGPAGQKAEVVINERHVGELALDEGGTATLESPISLIQGQNDIVLRYASDEPVVFDRLLVIRKIAEQAKPTDR